MQSRIRQGRTQIVDLVTLGPIAHAELNAEIDPDADEQHGESDRDRVERRHHHEAQGGGDAKAHEDADEYRQDDLGRAQRKPQDSQQQGERDGGIEAGVFLERAKFLVLDRNRAGEPHAAEVFCIDLDVGRRLPDRLGRELAGLERRIIKYRLDLNDPPQLARLGRLAGNQFAPGKTRWLSGHHVLQRRCEHGQWAREVVEREEIALNARQQQRQRLHQPTQIGIALQHLYDRLCLGEFPGDARDILFGQEQQGVAGKKVALRLVADDGEQIRLFGELLAERHAGLAGEFRGRGLDHRENRFVAVGERPVERKFSLAPRKISRD